MIVLIIADIYYSFPVETQRIIIKLSSLTCLLAETIVDDQAGNLINGTFQNPYTFTTGTSYPIYSL
jgi:hypothetical protein